MVERLLEQKKALVNYVTEHDLPAMLTKNQWGLLEKLVSLLEPFKQMTRDISSADASLADVIPVVTTLLVTLERHDNDAGVQTMKSVLLDDIKRRFDGMTDEPLYVIATTVDPRYRMRLFYVDQQTRASALLTAEVQHERQSTGVASPPAKRQRTDDESETGSKARLIMKELLSEPTQTCPSDQPSGTDAVVEQVRLFLAQPNISLESSPTAWWRDNAATFPDVAIVARRYLGAPATSVPSERLFSSAGLIYNDRRNRLLPERAEQLLFVKHNLFAVRELI